MTLYTNMEICEGCLNAVWCTECGHFKYCSIYKTGDAITGTCKYKKVAPQDNCAITLRIEKLGDD